MYQSSMEKLNELLEYVTPTKENKKKIEEIKSLIKDGNLEETVKKVNELFQDNNMNSTLMEEDIEESLEEEQEEIEAKEETAEKTEYFYIHLIVLDFQISNPHIKNNIY